MIVSTRVLSVTETVEQLDIPGSGAKRQIVQYRLTPNGELLAENDSFYQVPQMVDVIQKLQQQNQELLGRIPATTTAPQLTPAEELATAITKASESREGIKNLEKATQEACRTHEDNMETVSRAYKAVGNLIADQGRSITVPDNVIKG